MNTTYYYQHIIPLVRFKDEDPKDFHLWQKSDENRLLSLHNEGLMPSEIVKAFPHRTVAGIKLKLARLLKQ